MKTYNQVFKDFLVRLGILDFIVNNTNLQTILKN